MMQFQWISNFAAVRKTNEGMKVRQTQSSSSSNIVCATFNFYVSNQHMTVYPTGTLRRQRRNHRWATTSVPKRGGGKNQPAIYRRPCRFF